MKFLKRNIGKDRWPQHWATYSNPSHWIDLVKIFFLLHEIIWRKTILLKIKVFSRFLNWNILNSTNMGWHVFLEKLSYIESYVIVYSVPQIFKLNYFSGHCWLKTYIYQGKRLLVAILGIPLRDEQFCTGSHCFPSCISLLSWSFWILN